MYCKKCGFEINDNAKFCMECGTPTNDTLVSTQNNNLSVKVPESKKKNGCFVIGLIVMGIVIAIIFILTIVVVSLGLYKVPKNESTSSSNSLSQESALSEEEYKAQCQTCTYNYIARDENALKGEFFKFTGEIKQVGEDYYRVAVTEEYRKGNNVSYNSDDIIMVEYKYDGGSRLLEHDIITFWGKSKGFYTYTTVLGNTISVPHIKSKYIELESSLY